MMTRNIILNNVRLHNYVITQGTYIGYMFRLKISHLQAYFLSFESQDAIHTLGFHCVHIHGIHKIKSFVSPGVTCKHNLHVTPFETNYLIICIPCM